MKTVIIQYNAGNIRSVSYALKRLGFSGLITGDPKEIRRADRVIFPGVGAAGSTMKNLKERGLDKVIISLSQPVLGICLGMQLLTEFSWEGETRCLSVLGSEVKRFQGDQKIPHMGWNTIYDLKGPLFRDIEEGSFVYFVHSYYVPLDQQTTARTNYLGDFSASMHYNNFFATQFHPEKSGEIGLHILKNFLRL